MSDYEYDYERYETLIKQHLDVMWRDPDCLEIGENISDVPDIKIIFDGYGDLEDEDENGEYRYTEGGNTNMESYAIFIHKDSGQKGFEFPEHEMTPWCLIHRPKEEVCIYAWYDVENDDWTINGLYDTSEHEMTDEEVMNILEELNKQYFSFTQSDGEMPKAEWPFPTKNETERTSCDVCNQKYDSCVCVAASKELTNQIDKSLGIERKK